MNADSLNKLIASYPQDLFALEMKKIASMGEQGCDDNGIRFTRMEAHAMADELLCYALEKLGYKEGVEIFKSIPKWYA